MNFEEFFVQAERRNLSMQLDQDVGVKDYQLNNEALFQMPLISLVVLLFSKDRRKPFVAEIGQLVGEAIEKSIVGFKGSSQHLGWSANLRLRTVKAVNFLERTNLITVEPKKGKLTITDLGVKVITKATSGDDDLAYNLARIQRSYRNICVEKQLDLDIL